MEEIVSYYIIHNEKKIQDRYYLENNKKEGKYYSYYPNGNMMIVTEYKNDKLDGPFLSWYNDEDILKSTQKHIECHFKNGLLQGNFYSYYIHGILHKECYYHKGLLNGYVKLYSNRGLLLSDDYYYNGIKYMEMERVEWIKGEYERLEIMKEILKSYWNPTKLLFSFY